MIYSFSRLKTYETCSYRFYNKYVLERADKVTLPLALGKAAHKTIEDKINNVKEADAISNGLVEADFFEGVDQNDLKFFLRQSGAKVGMGKTELHFKLPLSSDKNSPVIQGYIDLIQGDGKYPSITDWKTNRVPYHVLDNHQIGLYAWAMNQLYGSSYVYGSLYFLRFKRVSKHCYTIKDMEDAKSWALKLANEINFKLMIYDMMPEKATELFPAQATSQCNHCPFAVECMNNFVKI